MNPRLAIIETACSPGLAAVAQGEGLLEVRPLAEARRHARDLVPSLKELLDAHDWSARQLDGIIVSIGPGSYTGLRVGIMTAKTLTHATGCALLGVETFSAIAQQTPGEVLRVDVLADAQQDKIYVQSFLRQYRGEPMKAQSALTIQAFDDWLAGLEKDIWISGPGLERHEERLRGRLLAPATLRKPSAESLLTIGLERWQRGERDDFLKLEPIYLRPSAAEEQWAKSGEAGHGRGKGWRERET